MQYLINLNINDDIKVIIKKLPRYMSSWLFKLSANHKENFRYCYLKACTLDPDAGKKVLTGGGYSEKNSKDSNENTHFFLNRSIIALKET